MLYSYANIQVFSKKSKSVYRLSVGEKELRNRLNIFAFYLSSLLFDLNQLF